MGCEGSKSTGTSNSIEQENEKNKKPQGQPSVGFIMGNAQIEALKQAFREVDVNNDNSLSIEELRKVFEKQGGLSNRDIQQFLVDADQNGNRRVEFDEFVALITAKMEQTVKDLRVVFDSFDSDKSGSLTKKELTQLLKVLEVESSDRVEKCFQKIDENKDGKVTFDEFIVMAMDL